MTKTFEGVFDQFETYQPKEEPKEKNGEITAERKAELMALMEKWGPVGRAVTFCETMMPGEFWAYLRQSDKTAQDHANNLVAAAFMTAGSLSERGEAKETAIHVVIGKEMQHPKFVEYVAEKAKG